MSQSPNLAAFFSAIPTSVRGALLMTASCACFTSMTAIIRHVSGELHPIEIAFFRNLFGLAFIMPWLLRTGIEGLRTQRFGLHVFRTSIGLCAMLTWFTAISLMPIAELTALSFTAPMFATIGAALFLGEVVRIRRWAAILIGFVGTMIILRPDVGALGSPALLALASSAFMGVSALVIKVLSRTEAPSAMVLYMGLLMTPLSLVPALFVWKTPPPDMWVWLVSIGLLATIGQLSLIRAFRSSDISAVLPFDFSRLIFAAILGFIFFAERPDTWTWVGAMVIFSSTLYTAHREARLNKRIKPAHDTLRQPPIDGVTPAPPVLDKDG